ncbi:hypothetical protein [Acinetobacter towneri]|uniref:hypothetical protein n=1 Tax=Acinetobacter towneri TaxID=202956 RepID=UPI002097E842|nr:hypothetical protein [Acinetobacter towneri]MCO8058061.1 hypothetical protein [Acinetobacter towneri]MCO8063707.1 hypothetical protein [Acinetobacter towneri]
MSWKNKPSNFALEIERVGGEHLRKVSADMLQGVIMASPVMDGAFRSNHRVTVNKTTNETVPSNGNKAPKGTLDQQVFAEGAGQILQAKLGDNVYIQNNLPYALRLENGHSQQAENGIYALTFLSVASKHK